MGKYDYPSEELKRKNYSLYMLQKVKAQEYSNKLSEFEGMAKYHAEQAKFHKNKSKEFKTLYEELKKENE